MYVCFRGLCFSETEQNSPPDLQETSPNPQEVNDREKVDVSRGGGRTSLHRDRT